jgi:hypothetical protein
MLKGPGSYPKSQQKQAVQKFLHGQQLSHLHSWDGTLQALSFLLLGTEHYQCPYSF